jgi:hypothetical protein
MELENLGASLSRYLELEEHRNRKYGMRGHLELEVPRAIGASSNEHLELGVQRYRERVVNEVPRVHGQAVPWYLPRHPKTEDRACVAKTLIFKSFLAIADF